MRTAQRVGECACYCFHCSMMFVIIIAKTAAKALKKEPGVEGTTVIKARAFMISQSHHPISLHLLGSAHILGSLQRTPALRASDCSEEEGQQEQEHRSHLRLYYYPRHHYPRCHLLCVLQRRRLFWRWQSRERRRRQLFQDVEEAEGRGRHVIIHCVHIERI